MVDRFIIYLLLITQAILGTLYDLLGYIFYDLIPLALNNLSVYCL